VEAKQWHGILVPLRPTLAHVDVAGMHGKQRQQKALPPSGQAMARLAQRCGKLLAACGWLRLRIPEQSWDKCKNEFSNIWQVQVL
jgi:hypothetical protein